MLEAKAEAKVVQLLSSAGVTVNGEQPWDMQVHDKRLFRRIMKEPSLGVGEGYVDGWWDCERIDVLFYRMLRDLHGQDVYKVWSFLRHVFINAISNQQSSIRSIDVAHQHYNIGNDLYVRMLGETMAYTCGYWESAETLDKAQYDKYDLICKKLEFKPGEKVLDMGCGWGGFAKFAVENYAVEVVAVNISSPQIEYGKVLCEGYPIQLVNCDYRDIKKYNPNSQKFDKIISVGLCEHVGYKNYDTYFMIMREQLKEDGLALLHTIGKNHSTYYTDPWIQKYIFPHGTLPTIKLLSRAIEGKFIIEDVHNFGSYYDRTLMRWCENFEKAWPELKIKYDQRFYRMWRYYLLSCAGAFRARDLQLWQFVMSPHGVVNGYKPVR